MTNLYWDISPLNHKFYILTASIGRPLGSFGGDPPSKTIVFTTDIDADNFRQFVSEILDTAEGDTSRIKVDYDNGFDSGSPAVIAQVDGEIFTYTEGDDNKYIVQESCKMLNWIIENLPVENLRDEEY